MKFDRRIVLRAAVVGAALLATGACGGADPDASGASPTTVVTSIAERADLAGLRVEVRRDPG